MPRACRANTFSRRSRRVCDRLDTDYIDLYQLHGPDPFTPLEETLRALDDLVKSGKVRYIGCSNFFGWQMVKANAVAEKLGLTRLISGQHLYNLLRRDIEREVLPAAADQGMGMLCWSAIAGGLLAGKYEQKSGPPKDSRVGQRANIDLPRYWNDESFRIIDEVVAVAKETGKTAAEVALAWLLGDRRVTAVIVGAKRAEQVTDWLSAGDWDLPTSYARSAHQCCAVLLRLSPRVDGNDLRQHRRRRRLPALGCAESD